MSAEAQVPGELEPGPRGGGDQLTRAEVLKPSDLPAAADAENPKVKEAVKRTVC